MAGRIGLVGSGEYLPVMHEVERSLLAGRPPRYVQLATAAAPEGPQSLGRWHGLGAAAAQRLGVQQVIVDVRTRADADDEQFAGLIDGAGLIYLSGGNPTYLATTLAGTAVWRAIEAAWLNGASLAGCSAGAMALAGHVPDFRRPRHGGVPGLGVVPDIRVLPHFDRLAGWLPDFALNMVTAARHTNVIGVDEDTALVGEPAKGQYWRFTVQGRQSAWIVGPAHRQQIVEEVSLRVATPGGQLS